VAFFYFQIVEIPSPKHQMPNNTEYQNPKFETFLDFEFWNCLAFGIWRLEFKNGIFQRQAGEKFRTWIPAFAGMTKKILSIFQTRVRANQEMFGWKRVFS